MKKENLSEYKIAVFSAFISILFTAIYDWLKQKPLLTTLLDIIKWLWKNIFEFEIKIWLLLIIIIVYKISKIIIKSFNKPKNITTTSKSFINYSEETIDGIKWKWKWEKNPLTGKINIQDLKPICNKCGTSMDLNENGYKVYADCPRCDNEISNFKDTQKIEAIIIDNVQRDLF
ncbi:MAG TPA: hypothetical protein VK164_02010 [Flavobacterium sp.]|uniref:hypothetical protein n=1 Tax=Flavobacterium sp. TaxID=239 RepID=UPI002B4B7597|nr:hypothetical protein [Flavobacterium sp.]HLO72687.1 hypothetical protein [Flavobacterium sp.]